MEYTYCHALKGNVKQVSNILNEVYFNRKFKIKTYTYKDLDIVFKRIQNTPEYTQFLTSIDKDLQPMRNNAINFLKEEGKWPQNTSE